MVKFTVIGGGTSKDLAKRLARRLKAVYIETETNQFWLQWSEGDLLALDIFSLMHSVEGGFNKNERLLRGRYYFGKGYTGDPHGKRPVTEFI